MKSGKKIENPYVIVGSGPAGVSAASALLDRGKSVLMLDSGIEVEPELEKKINSLLLKPNKNWKDSDTAFLKSNEKVKSGQIPNKYSYGSNFPYQIPSLGPCFSFESNVGLRPSFARGGLSNVWGASLLPYLDEDILDWPVTRSDLEPHYQAVSQLFSTCGKHDQLEDLFPLYSTSLLSLDISPQMESVFSKMYLFKETLIREGLWFGQSRLAFNHRSFSYSGECTYCGLCMYGCPWKLIYSSSSSLLELKKNPNFKYIGGFLVESFKENLDSVMVYGSDLKTLEQRKFHAAKLFLASGVIMTTVLVARSCDYFNLEFQIKDSQYFIFPLILEKVPLK